MSDNKELRSLIEEDAHSNRLTVMASLFLAFALFVGGHSIYKIIQLSVDNSVPIVNCPKAYSLDAPVILKPVAESETKNKDRWVRGFVRRFVHNQFPRVKEDVAPFLSWVTAHTRGGIHSKYGELARNSSTVENMVDNGYFFRFYPKDSEDVRIRASDVPGKWVVEIEGYLIKRTGSTEERTSPTLRYEIEADKATLDNPEGLYVTSTNIEVITDYVSGRKK